MLSMHLTWLLAKLRKFVLHLTEAPRADNTFNLHAPSRPGGICQMDTELPLGPSHHVQNMFKTIMRPIFTSRQMDIKIICTSATECHFRRIATQIIFPSNEPCNSAASRYFDYIDGHQSCASNRNIIARAPPLRAPPLRLDSQPSDAKSPQQGAQAKATCQPQTACKEQHTPPACPELPKPSP